MLLTSYERMRRYLAPSGGSGDALTDSYRNRRDITMLIGSISNRIEGVLNRALLTQSRTEYFDIQNNREEYWVQAFPIVSITSIYVDYDGQYTGNEFALETDEYTTGRYNNSVVLIWPYRIAAKRAMRVIYIGGIAYHGTQSTYALSSVVGTWVVGKYCVGATSGAIGIVKAASATTLTVEVLYGIFTVSETLSMYTNEDLTDTPSVTAVLSSKTTTALCESYPDITTACENELRFYWKHKHDFELSSIQKDATSRRSAVDTSTIQPETKNLLSPYIYYRIP